jgi:hypothetical protein
MANGVRVKELPQAVLSSGIASQPKALQLCQRFANQGIKATIGMLPGVAGYQVSVYAMAVEAVKGLLGQWGVDVHDDAIA